MKIEGVLSVHGRNHASTEVWKIEVRVSLTGVEHKEKELIIVVLQARYLPVEPFDQGLLTRFLFHLATAF